MALYEHVVISRQDISPQQAEALNDQIKAIIEEHGGAVAKIEYWGLRNLTYRAPFGHAGQFADLDAIVRFYETGGLARPSKSPLMKPISLARTEREELIAFLRSLTADPT